MTLGKGVTSQHLANKTKQRALPRPNQYL